MLQKTHAVRNTWGKKCDKFLVMSAKYRDSSYPGNTCMILTKLGSIDKKSLCPTLDDVISLNVSYQYEKLWERTVLAFTHVWQNYGGQFDFILKVGYRYSKPTILKCPP